MCWKNEHNKPHVHPPSPTRPHCATQNVQAILEVCGSLGVALKRGACCCTCKDRENLARTRKIVWFFVNMSDQSRVLRASGHTKKKRDRRHGHRVWPCLRKWITMIAHRFPSFQRVSLSFCLGMAHGIRIFGRTIEKFGDENRAHETIHNEENCPERSPVSPTRVC